MKQHCIGGQLLSLLDKKISILAIVKTMETIRHSTFAAPGLKWTGREAVSCQSVGFTQNIAEQNC